MTRRSDREDVTTGFGSPVQALLIAAGLAAMTPAALADDVHYVDQGPNWTHDARDQFYTQDEGSQLIPRAWLRALTRDDGTSFLASLPRYGFLPNADPSKTELPIGFTDAPSVQGRMVGMTCAACHVRQMVVDGTSYRIDGGPAFVDFAAFVADLDAAVARALATKQSFDRFAGLVLGVGSADEVAREQLQAEVRYWRVRFHALVAGSLPDQTLWGPTRLDAIAVIYNFIAGLDIGPPPTFLIPANIQRGNAPVRYPFLWNVQHQDFTQWTGIAEFGNEDLALARNLSEIFGVFAGFRPVATPGAISVLNRNYLLHNSSSFDGFAKIDGLLAKLGSPVWPWPLDRPLAKQGEAIFNRPSAQGGCVECHGVHKGISRQTFADSWKTPILDVGTDTRAWDVLLRKTGTGSLAGAAVPDAVPPLKASDLALNLLKVSVMGTIVDQKTAGALAHPVPALAISEFISSRKEGPKTATPEPNRYEARVLHGIWAAAPYLHNGSVPTLDDLLKPAAQRPTAFRIGPHYDVVKIGLAADQTDFDFTLRTTGCDNRASGNSNCGHEFGAHLPDPERKALLEYLKTL